PEVEFDMPAIMEKVDDGVLGIALGIGQRRHHHQFPDAESRLADLSTYLPQGQGLGHGRVGGLIHPLVTLRFVPYYFLIIPAVAKTVRSRVMEAKDAVGPFGPEHRRQPIGTI